MGLAELVDAPVLLVGDIDRGGVFAQLYGTVALLEQQERERIKGVIVNKFRGDRAILEPGLKTDIDRGGVFAQLYGTVALLEQQERERIKGVIVNKFRGDRAILEPGLKTLESLCGVPVAGVVPYVHVDIDDEDSLSSRFGANGGRKLLDAVVIRLPRISNFTDFSPLERYENLSLRYVDRVSQLGSPDLILLPGTKSTIADLPRISNFTDFSPLERYENLSLRYVDRVSQLGSPDLILLPGTKSTIADLQWLRQSGLEAAISKAADAGVLVFGICGGYQMLGQWICDPDRVEAADVSEIAGLGLLPHTTTAADAGVLVFGICGGYQMLGQWICDPDRVEAADVSEIAGLGLLPHTTTFRAEKVQTQTHGVFSRLSDAGPVDLRPGPGRSGGCVGDCRPRPAAPHHNIPGRKGTDTDPRRVLPGDGNAVRAEWAGLHRL